MAEYSTTNPLIAPDGLSITPIWTTIITQSDGITEQRKAKQLFPKYDVKLSYPNGISPADIKIIYAFYMARKGAYGAFYIYDREPDEHVSQFVGWGDGVTSTFDIPGITTSEQKIYIDGVEISSNNYTILTGGGVENSDRVSFGASGGSLLLETGGKLLLESGGDMLLEGISSGSPPISGQLITCTFTGYLRMRVRFKEDKLSKETLTHLLYRGGEIEFKGLSAEDL